MTPASAGPLPSREGALIASQPVAVDRGAARRAAGRITPDEVVHTAVDLTRVHGLAGLTLRAVAQELGVQSPSLYHHIPGGLDELQARVVHTVVTRLEAEVQQQESADETPWQRLERPLRTVGRLAGEYPGVLQYVLSTGRDHPHALASAERTVRQLLESELGPMAPAAWLLVHTYVTGWVFARRPSSTAADANGFLQLGAVLHEAEALDEEKVLFEGLRALLAGLLVSSRDREVAARGPGTADRTLGTFLA